MLLQLMATPVNPVGVDGAVVSGGRVVLVVVDVVIVVVLVVIVVVVDDVVLVVGVVHGRDGEIVHGRPDQPCGRSQSRRIQHLLQVRPRRALPDVDVVALEPGAARVARRGPAQVRLGAGGGRRRESCWRAGRQG